MSEKLRRIKIISNKDGTKVVDAETGEDLASTITDIRIWFDTKRLPIIAVAEVTFHDVDIEIEADVEVETTKTYRRLERT